MPLSLPCSCDKVASADVQTVSVICAVLALRASCSANAAHRFRTLEPSYTQWQAAGCGCVLMLTICTGMPAHLFVMAALCFGSSLGMYMMIPTQLNSAPGLTPIGVAATAASAEAPAAAAAAGLMGLLLPEVHRCSIGLGAGILLASISFSKSSM